jgi:2-polyprenyl-3-methyl-5-hydroxy-6-metoxy-1,4-benzoquinol methylase
MFREEGIRPPQYIEAEIVHKIDFLASFRNPKIQQSILEIGCADGTTLVNFRKRGFAVSGIEPSMENANICRRKNLEIFNCTYKDFRDSRKFDFICSYYTMEHLTSPVKFLSFCNSLLHDNGIICIEIPDIEAYKKERITYDLLFFFEHQHHFTKETVKILLERCGFELLTFSDRTTHDFGMHFAARKVSEPMSLDDLHIPNNVFDSVMREVTEYGDHFAKKLVSLKETVQSIFINSSKRDKKIVLCPASLGTKMLLELPEVDINSVKFIIDNSPNKWGRTLCGIPICAPKMLDSTIETIVIMSSFSGEIKDQLISMGINEEKIVIL